MLQTPDVAFAPLFPILSVLVGGLISTLFFGKVPRRSLTIINMVALVLSAASMISLWGTNQTAFFGHIQADSAAILLGLIILLGSFITLLVSLDTAWRARLSFPELDAMLMFAITGCLLMAFSANLMTMLVGLEIMSLAGYVLTTLQSSRRSEEAGLKYFLLGAVGSAILIYGIAFLYGATGQFGYAGIADAVADLNLPNQGILVGGVLLVLVGFAFKVALVPFHQWTPDVYSGAPTSISLFLSTVVKVAAFAAMLRLFAGALAGAPAWPMILQILVALTLVIGNTAALLQTNFKRMLAYSAIAHTGFLAMCLLALPKDGGPALTFYLLVYTLMTAAALAVVAALQRTEAGMEIHDMRGLFYRHPAYAVALLVCLLSLAGIPPLAGFMGKFMAFQAAYQNDYVWLSVLAALTSVAALIYYLRPAFIMFMPDRTPAREYAHGQRPATNISVLLGSVGVLILGFLPWLAYAWLKNDEIWRVLAGS